MAMTAGMQNPQNMFCRRNYLKNTGIAGGDMPSGDIFYLSDNCKL